MTNNPNRAACLTTTSNVPVRPKDPGEIHVPFFCHDPHPRGNLSGVLTITPLFGRLLLSAIFILSGVSKVAAPAATIGYIESVGLPFAQFSFGIAVLVEIVGGAALVLGYRARLAAAILAAFTVTAAVAFHSDLADQNQFVHFFKNIAMTGGLLQVVAFGAGSFSLDARAR